MPTIASFFFFFFFRKLTAVLIFITFYVTKSAWGKNWHWFRDGPESKVVNLTLKAFCHSAQPPATAPAPCSLPLGSLTMFVLKLSPWPGMFFSFVFTCHHPLSIKTFSLPFPLACLFLPSSEFSLCPWFLIFHLLYSLSLGPHIRLGTYESAVYS